MALSPMRDCVLPGQVEDEFLISTHVCHPSMANDNLSGAAVATALASILARTSHRFTYRFLFVPGTIGPIARLSRNQDKLAGSSTRLVLACVGDGEASTTSAADASRPISTGPWSTSCRRREPPSRSAIFHPTAMTKDSSVRRDFNFPVGSFRRTPGRHRPNRTSG